MLLRWICLSAMTLLLLAGCLTAPTDTPAPAAVPEPASAADVPVTVPSPGLAFREPVIVDPVPSAHPLDPVTRADNELLQGADQSPPEEVGDTIPHEEPLFDFPVTENEKVRYYLDYFSGRAKNTFTLWLERSGRYLPMMQEVFAEAGLPRDLAYLAMVESGFNPKAYSWAHAVGPWQFIESTGRRYDLDNDWWHDERRDPAKATRAAARYLADLHRQFDGDWYLAVASYNAGPGKVRTAIRKYGTRDFWELSRGSYLRRETKNYLPKLLAALLIAKQPEKYGFTDIDYQEPLVYDTAILPSSTDLEVIASLSGVDYQTIKQLNPELKRWCTPPDERNFEIRLPAGTGERFAAAYRELPAGKRANYVRHKVRSGDTLLAMAKHYRVRVQDITRLNQIRNPRALQIGTNLIIPLNPEYNRQTVAELEDDHLRTRRRVYQVRSGDSIWSISRRFGVSEQQLRVWNRLGWSNVIRPGQRLVVSASAVSSRPSAKASAATGPLKKVIYKVRPGDTLWGIGREFAVETHQIRSWNNLAEGAILRPGDHLTLMVRGGASG